MTGQEGTTAGRTGALEAARADPGPERPPSVDALARSLSGSGLPDPVLVDVARRAVAAGGATAAIEARATDEVGRWERRLLQPVVNATGVLLHTNLGRAPLGHAQDAAYVNVELDLHTGRRGSRSDHAARLVALATGAEAALAVNNGAAAVLLALTALGAGRQVVVSRGEAVEIGGGFRIPDVLTASGARLVEVGTTNRTRLADYRHAVEAAGDELGAVLKVHQSNYRIVGFTQAVGVAALAALGAPVVVDVGSGLLDARCPWLAGPPPRWLADEPAVRQTLEAGAALVTFSGDKLLGGPQAGIIAGRADLVAACASHPLARALRPGGLVLAALQDTALAYLRRDGTAIPFWRLVSTPQEVLEHRATAIADAVVAACGIRPCVEPTIAVPGGGSLPGVALPSVGLVLDGDRADALRDAAPAVLAHVHDGRTVCDLRTVLPEQDAHLATAIAHALTTAPGVS